MSFDDDGKPLNVLLEFSGPLESSPFELYKIGESFASINFAFEKSFNLPVGITLPESRPALFAGSSVLACFYGESNWVPSDIDIFIPVGDCDFVQGRIGNWDYLIPGLVSTSGDAKRVLSESSIYSTRMHVEKYVDANDKKVDVVYVWQGLLRAYTDEKLFHKTLEDTFDIKICALAWNGKELFYPSTIGYGLGNKTSTMRKNTQATRIEKYRARGFNLEE